MVLHVFAIKYGFVRSNYDLNNEKGEKNLGIFALFCGIFKFKLLHKVLISFVKIYIETFTLYISRASTTVIIIFFAEKERERGPTI